jgi:cbb3-type cytochrome oxidase subunit 3
MSDYQIATIVAQLLEKLTVNKQATAAKLQTAIHDAVQRQHDLDMAALAHYQGAFVAGMMSFAIFTLAAVMIAYSLGKKAGLSHAALITPQQNAA